MCGYTHIHLSQEVPAPQGIWELLDAEGSEVAYSVLTLPLQQARRTERLRATPYSHYRAGDRGLLPSPVPMQPRYHRRISASVYEASDVFALYLNCKHWPLFSDVLRPGYPFLLGRMPILIYPGHG